MTTATPPANKSRHGLWQLILIWVLAPLLLALVVLAQFEWSYRNRIYPGVQAMGVDLSGMNLEEAENALGAAAQTYDLPPLALRHGDQVWPLKSEELGVEVNVDEVVASAFALGRSSSVMGNLAAQTEAFWQGYTQSPALQAVPGAVTAAVTERTTQLNRPVTEPKLSLSDLQVVISAPRPGQLVDVEATRNTLLSKIASGRGGVVDVTTQQISASGTDISAGQEAIESLLNEPIVLTDALGEFEFAVDPATLAGMLLWVPDDDAPGGVRAEVQTDQLSNLVDSWAEQVARPPLNARLDFSENFGTLVELSPSVEGYALNKELTVAAILSAIESGESQVTLPVDVLYPQVSSENISSLGIKELVAQGKTRFTGSSEARVKNIEVAASKFVGVVIPPDGAFSFNEHVGDITAANGFEDSLIISGNSTAVGVGGGVCQVSTTAFRAAWNAGLPIEERWNHGYVVNWYGEPGLDATIYTPTVDFKFKNTTGHHLLVKPIVDSAQGTVTFQFYGTKPDWIVEREKPVQSDLAAAPPPLYVEDPGLPDGKVVQYDWAVEGMQTVAKRKVLAADGTVLTEDTLKSKYLPWQAKYRFGPGVTPPAGAEVIRIEAETEESAETSDG